MRRAAAVPAGAVTLALVAAACALAWRPDSPLVPRNGGHVSGTAPLFLALLLGAFATYLLALLAIRRGAPSTRAVIVLAAAIQLVPLAAPLLLSTDAWTYWSYGWIAARGDGNPYAEAPQSFPANPALPSMGSAWLDTTSVYGPAFTMASEPVAVVAGDSSEVAAWSFKGLAAAAALAAALLAGRLARRRRSPSRSSAGTRCSRCISRAAGTTTPGSARWSSLRWRSSASRRLQGAGAMWVLAIAVKWVPMLFFALRAVEARATGRPTAHLGFGLATAAVVAVVGERVVPTGRPGRLQSCRSRATRRSRRATRSRTGSSSSGFPTTLALGLAVAALLGGLAWLAREAGRGRARLGLAACLVLATTPYLAVWYLGWAVPLAAAEEDAVATGACLVLCAYLLPQTIPRLEQAARPRRRSTTTPSSSRTTCQRGRAGGACVAQRQTLCAARRVEVARARQVDGDPACLTEHGEAEDPPPLGEVGAERVGGADRNVRRHRAQIARAARSWRVTTWSRVASFEPNGTWLQTGSGPSTTPAASTSSTSARPSAGDERGQRRCTRAAPSTARRHEPRDRGRGVVEVDRRLRAGTGEQVERELGQRAQPPRVARAAAGHPAAAAGPRR